MLTNLHARHLFSKCYSFSFGLGTRDTMRVRCMIHLDHAHVHVGRQGIVFRRKEAMHIAAKGVRLAVCVPLDPDDASIGSGRGRVRSAGAG
jgi:hypothetical protein